MEFKTEVRNWKQFNDGEFHVCAEVNAAGTTSW